MKEEAKEILTAIALMLGFGTIFSGIVGGVFLLGVLSIVIDSAIVFVAWNYVLPVMFGLPVITFLQALALRFLAGALIKSKNHNSNICKCKKDEE